VTLRDWQARLSRHFSVLAEGRSAQRGSSVFVLEHGLTPDELAGLSSAVRAQIFTSPPLREHELPWMVYAAELGYRYSGDEYWQTFEKETPGWIRHGKRDWIRDCFKAFKHRGGAVPSGPWAAHFSIICWPLTHAIIPRDLQVQLARLLYDLRFQFTRDLIDSPQELGNLISLRSWRCTSRFQDFARQQAIIGQIAAALVTGAGEGQHGFLLDSTLLRITADLEKQRDAREWLTRARNEARDRTSLHGLLLPAAGRVADLRNTDPARAKEAARQETFRLGIEARLQVRRSSTVEGGWDLFVELPDLSPLLIAFPEFAATLKGSRCTVAGYHGRPLARERLLHRGEPLPLHEWPRPDEVLLHFDQAPWELDFLLRTDSLLTPSPIRLFRIGPDGIGYELKQASVRAGCRYLAISTGTLTTTAPRVQISCAGLAAVLLEVPTPLTSEWQDRLRHLGIGQSVTLTVWPVGVPAAKWDREGRAEWLTSERPLIAIRSDYPVASLSVRLDRLVPLEQTGLSGDRPSYIELPALPPGRHTVSIVARDHAGREQAGELEVTSREPVPWSPSASPGSALLVSVDPPRPSLEDLWEGRVSIEVAGPVGRAITCDIALYDAEGAPPRTARRFTNMSLPVTEAGWKDLLRDRITSDGGLSAAYDAARYALLRLAAGEFGLFELRCARESTPLRWSAATTNIGRSITLLDDTGFSDAINARHYDFARPDVALSFDRLEAGTAVEVSADGGLYVAERGSALAAMVIAPRVTLQDFAALAFDPQLASRDRHEGAVLASLRLIKLWADARLFGGVFASLRQQTVLLAFTRHLVFLLGGNSWDQAERLATTTGRLEGLRRAVGTRWDEASLASAIWECAATMARQSVASRVLKFSSLLQSHLHLRLPPGEVAGVGPGGERLIDRHRDSNPEHPDWLAELGLRLASDPARATTWLGTNLKMGVSHLIEKPQIPRAARFAVLCIGNYLPPEPVPAGRVHAGWEWP